MSKKVNVRQVLIQKVFPALRRANLFARADYWCCRTCGHAAATYVAVKKSKKGYVFWHHQTEVNYRQGRSIFLQFDGPIPDDKVATKVGKMIAEECRNQGLRVVWNGTSAKSIQVTRKPQR